MRVVVCWAPAQAEYGAAAGHLSLSCRRRFDGWVQRQGSDARQASGTSTVLDEKAARAGGGGGRFPEAPWTHTGERSVGVANRGPLSLGTYPGVQSDRTVGSLGEAWRVRGRGWGSLRGAWHFFSPSPSFNCIDAAAQSVVSPHRRTRRHGSIIGAPDKQWTWTRTKLESSGHEIPRLPGGLLSVVRHCARRPSRETAESACEAVAHLPPVRRFGVRPPARRPARHRSVLSPPSSARRAMAL